MKHRVTTEAMADGLGLAIFMLVAMTGATILEAPVLGVPSLIPSASLRRLLMGALMGSTAFFLIRSRLGQFSGAHFNPAVTLAFLRLGRLSRAAAMIYIAAQCAGALLGVAIARLILGTASERPPVDFVATVPAPGQSAVAFAAELVMAGALFGIVLEFASRERLKAAAPAVAGCLVAAYIFLAAPLSGMSINPARTLGSFVLAGHWEHYWIYVGAPLLGMQMAAHLHRWKRTAIECPKIPLHAAASCRYCSDQGAASQR